MSLGFAEFRSLLGFLRVMRSSFLGAAFPQHPMRSFVPALRIGAVVAAVLGGCGYGDAEGAKKALTEVHQGELKALLARTEARHLKGTRDAAARLGPGFLLPEGERVEALRLAMRQLRDPTRAPRKTVQELVSSPRRFMVALDAEGKVLTRDLEDPARDRLRGQSWATDFPLVRKALDSGQAQQGPVALSGPWARGACVWMFVAPSLRDGKAVGALAVGIPLISFAGLVTRQLRLDHVAEKGLELWAYGYEGDDLVHERTPLRIDGIVPGAEARRNGLKGSREGFVGEAALGGRPYGFLVWPAPSFGAEAGLVIMRADPL